MIAASLRIAGPYVSQSGGAMLLPYGFPIRAAAHILVLRWRAGDISDLVLDVDYTVSGAGGPSGGYVTLAAPAVADDRYVVLGATPEERTTDIGFERGLASAPLNDQYDRLVMMIQELRRDIGRALARSAFDDPGAGPLQLPAAVPSSLMGFDVSGGLTLYPLTGLAGSGARPLWTDGDAHHAATGPCDGWRDPATGDLWIVVPQAGALVWRNLSQVVAVDADAITDAGAAGKGVLRSATAADARSQIGLDPIVWEYA